MFILGVDPFGQHPNLVPAHPPINGLGLGTGTGCGYLFITTICPIKDNTNKTHNIMTIIFARSI